MKTRRSAMKNTRRISICATSIAAFMAATPDSPGLPYNVILGDTFVEGGVVTGGTGLQKTGGGSLILTNAGNNYTGTTTISNGSVVISAASALGADASEIVVTGFNPTIGQATNLRGFGGGSLVLSGLGGAITIGRDLSLQGQGPIADRGGALISIGDNILSGTVTTAPLAFGATAINTTIISAAGTLGLTGGLNVGGTAGTTLTILGGVNQGGVTNYNLTGTLAGTGTLSKQGGGTLILNPSSSAGFSGTIRTNGSNASGQSTIRISPGGALGTRTGTTNASVLDLNGGILEVLSETSGLIGASAANSNVYVRASSAIFADQGVGGQGTNRTVEFGAISYEVAANPTFSSRNGYGMTFSTAAVITGDGNTTFTNSLQGGLLTFTGNVWSNSNGTGRSFSLTGNGDTLISGNIIAAAAGAADHNFGKSGSGKLTVTATGTTLDGNFNVNDGIVETNRIVGGIIGSASTNSVNIGTSNITGTLTFVGSAGTGAGETVAKNINLAGTSGGARINANQAGSSPSALVITTITAANNNVKTLTLGGSSTLENEIRGAIPNPGAGTVALNLAKSDGGTWVLSAANTYTGSTTISNGTLKLKPSAAAPTNTILQDASQVNFNADGVQAAGGRLVLAGAPATVTTETIGTINPVQGHGTIRVENGGATTTLAAAGLSAASGSIGASVNFEAPGLLDVITLGGTVDTARGNAYYNGANFAYIGAGNVLRAPDYGVDPLTVIAGGGALTAGSHNNITAAAADAGGATFASLKFSGSQTLTLTGTAAVNLGFQTSGGILVDGGNAVIAQGGGGAITQGLGSAANGGGALVIRTNQLTDSLALEVPITSSTTQGVSKNGLGTLILSAANNQAGATNINEGTIRLAPGGQLSAPNQALSIRQGATLDLNGVNQPPNTIGNLNGAGRVTNSNATTAQFSFGNGAGTGTFSGVIESGAGRVNVAKQSTGNVVLTGLNTYTGSTTIASTGTLTAGNLANIGSPSAIGAGDATSDSTNRLSLIFTGGQNVSTATGLALPGGLTYTGTDQVSTNRLFTLGGTAAGAGARITASGVNGAGIVFTNTAPVGYTAAGAIVAQNLVLAGANAADNRIDIQLVDSGVSGGSLQVNKIDAGKWVLGNNSNSYGGATKINGGTLEVTATSLSPNSALLFAGTLAVPAGGVLEANGSFTRALNAGTVANTVNFNANGNFAGSGGFAASGNKLTVNLGGASAPVAWNSGGFLMNGTVAATLRLSSPTALGEVDFQNPIDLGASVRTIQVDDNANTGSDFATISGALSGAGGGISKTGAGTLALTGANSYTGTTTNTAGTIVVRSLGSSGNPGATSVGDSTAGNIDAGAVLLGNGGTGGAILQYVGAGETSDRKIRLNTTTGTTQIHADGSGALILTNIANDAATGAKNLTLRGTNAAGNRIDNALTNSTVGVGGALSVTIDGSATWIFRGANTYTGATTVGAGALGIGNDTPFSGALVLSNGTVFAEGADRTLTGTVQQANSTTTGFAGANSLTINALTSLAAANGIGTNNNIDAGKSLTIGSVVSDSLTANRTWTIDGPGTTNLGNITSTTAFGLGITKTGTGTLNLNGAGSNFTKGGAGVDIDNGTVVLGNATAIPVGTAAFNVTFSPDAGQSETATLNLNGVSPTLSGLVTTAPNSSAVTIDNATGASLTLTIGANNGVINTNAALTSSGGGAISLVKVGTAAGNLSGTNINIAGTTTISAGSLAFTGDDPETTTGISVAGGSGLGLINGVGSSFSSLASLNLGAAASTASIGLDVGTVTDTLAIAGAATTAGTVNLSIGAAPGFGSSATYTLLQASSGLLGATYALNGIVPGGYSYTLTPLDSSVTLGVTANTANDFYWAGDLSTSWSSYNAGDTNWEDNPGNNLASVPGPLDQVIFNAVTNTPAGPTIVTTLDSPVAIDSLVFNGTVTSTGSPRVDIAAGTGGILTIDPSLSSDGISLPDNAGIASITAPIVLAGDQTWSVGSVGTPRPELIVTGVLSGTGNLTKLGVGTATVTGTSTRTGRTAIDAGTLRINAEAALGANPGALTANQLSLNGGTLRSTAGFTIDDTNRGITIGGGDGTFDTTGGSITIGVTSAPGQNVVDGPGQLRKEGGNTLVLNSANTYAGGTNINGGAVRAGNSSALGSGDVTLANTATILEFGDGVTVTNNATVTDGGNEKTFRLQAGAASATYSGNITSSELGGGNLRAQASAGGVLTLSGNIVATSPAGTASPALRINEAGGNTGVVVLSGTGNSYSGSTEVRQGILRNGASEVIPGAMVVNASVAASPSATYDLAGNNETVSSLTYGANASSTAPYVNSVTTGAGTLTLDGNVTTFANPGGSQVLTAVLAGNVSMAVTRTFTVANASAVQTDLLVSAAITGAGGLTKAGLGTMEMTGTSTYAGITTVSDGTLLVNGSISGTVTVSGGTLGGTGSVGAITSTSGVVSPGSSIGTLNAGGLDMSSGTSSFQLEINTNTNGAPTIDLLNMPSGALTLAVAGTPLTVTDLGVSINLTLGQRLPFIDYGNFNGGFFSVAGVGVINNLAEQFAVGPNVFQIDYNDVDGKVSLVVVPEPGIAASLLGGFGMLVGLQRIRRRSDRRS